MLSTLYTKYNKKNNNRGFTLIELMIVLLALSVLLTMGFPTMIRIPRMIRFKIDENTCRTYARKIDLIMKMNPENYFTGGTGYSVLELKESLLGEKVSSPAISKYFPNAKFYYSLHYASSDPDNTLPKDAIYLWVYVWDPISKQTIIKSTLDYKEGGTLYVWQNYDDMVAEQRIVLPISSTD